MLPAWYPENLGSWSWAGKGPHPMCTQKLFLGPLQPKPALDLAEPPARASQGAAAHPTPCSCACVVHETPPPQAPWACELGSSSGPHLP